MAISTQTLHETHKTITIKAIGVGSESDGILLDVAQMSGVASSSSSGAGGSPARVSIAKITWAINASAATNDGITLEWQADTDVEIMSLSGNGTINLYGSGMPTITVPSPEAAGLTGNVVLTSDSSVTDYIVIIEFHKVDGLYSDYYEGV